MHEYFWCCHVLISRLVIWRCFCCCCCCCCCFGPAPIYTVSYSGICPIFFLFARKRLFNLELIWKHLSGMNLWVGSDSGTICSILLQNKKNMIFQLKQRDDLWSCFCIQCFCVSWHRDSRDVPGILGMPGRQTTVRPFREMTAIHMQILHSTLTNRVLA